MSHLKLVISNKNIDTKTKKKYSIDNLKIVVLSERLDDDYHKILLKNYNGVYYYRISR